MKRPIVIVAMAYVAGLAAGEVLKLPPLLTLAIVAAIAVSQIILLTRRRAAVDLLLFAAVALIGDLQQARIEGQDHRTRELLASFPTNLIVRVEGRLASTERIQDERITFCLHDCTSRSDEGPVVEFPTAIQLTCSGAAFEQIREAPPAPGDRVVAEGRLARPSDLRNPDVFNYRAYLEQRGIGASLFVRRAEAVAFSSPEGWRSPKDLAVAGAEQLRRRIEAILDRTLDPAAATLNRSIFLGEAHLLDRDVRRDFTRCGLAHIFAVSGLNVVMLVWVLDTFIRLFGATPRVRSALLIACSVVFCAVVGFQASVVRATVMISALLAVPFLRYKVEPLTTLATAALFILLVDPRALWQPSFQLSFACMLSIILLGPPIESWLSFDEEKGSNLRKKMSRFANRHLVGQTMMILASVVGVMPLLAHCFHMVPLVGVLSNFIAAPLVWLLTATTLVLLGVAAVVPAATSVFGAAMNFFSHLLLGLVQEWSSLPAVSIFIPHWPAFAAAIYYAVLFGWGVLPREFSPFFEAKQRARLLLALAAVAAWLAWAPAVLQGSDDSLRATFLDVGQGDSCVLELPGGAVILIDGGDDLVHAGERIVVPFLEANGIEYLDAVIATHPDSDHIGGLPAVFRALAVGRLFEGPTPSRSVANERLLEVAGSRGVRQETVYAGDWIEASQGTHLSFLHPSRGVVFSQANDQSLVIRLEWGTCEILIAGDIQTAGERELVASGADLTCDVLKVAHHGSASATSAEFLGRARPALAVISCGRDNRFGHPAPGVVARLTAAGVAVARTDRDGAVTVQSDGKGVDWHSEGK